MRVNIDKIIPTIDVTGNPESKVERATLKIIASVGPSGKTVTVKKDNSEEAVVEGDSYEVIENGTYTITLTNGLGVKVSKEIKVENIRDKELEGDTVTPETKPGTATITPETAIVQGDKEEKQTQSNPEADTGDTSAVTLLSSLVLGAIGVFGTRRKRN